MQNYKFPEKNHNLY